MLILFSILVYSMSLKSYIFLIIAGLPLSLAAQSPVLQIFSERTYNPVLWENVENITLDLEEEHWNIKTTDGQLFTPELEDAPYIVSGEALPHIIITTDETLTEIPDKVNYKKADFSLEGFDEYEDISRRIDIRGRGNSSWGFPKKPYRVKFDKKVSLCGLPAAKNYVLLANYTDPSLLQFALATRIGDILELPYTNSVVPVDVTLNGVYKGSYMLTNKPGINAGSVDIDEDNSIMWELDIAYDGDLQFRSPLFDLPVMVADPDMDEETFEMWKQDFIDMEKGCYEGRPGDYFDLDIFARYLLVYEIMGVSEIGFPKSVKFFKTKGGKYIMGPIWDFDVAMGTVWDTQEHYTLDNINELVWTNWLFGYIEVDPEAIAARKKYWAQMKEKLPELLDYVDEYAESIRSSAIRNQTIWPDYDKFDASVSSLKNWLTLRFEALDKIIPYQ